MKIRIVYEVDLNEPVEVVAIPEPPRPVDAVKPPDSLDTVVDRVELAPAGKGETVVRLSARVAKPHSRKSTSKRGRPPKRPTAPKASRRTVDSPPTVDGPNAGAPSSPYQYVRGLPPPYRHSVTEVAKLFPDVGGVTLTGQIYQARSTLKQEKGGRWRSEEIANGKVEYWLEPKEE